MRVLLPLLLAAVAQAQTLPTGFAYRSVTLGQLDLACSMAFAPDGRLFVCERLTGQIRVVRGGVVDPLPWAVLAVGGSAQTDAGLLGIAVDPQFLTNGYVYAYHTDPTTTEHRIVRLQDSQGLGINPTILTAPGAIPATLIHGGGRMVFGVDGKLFVQVGEGGNVHLAQDLNILAGKVLRFETPNLGIPQDNPIAGSAVYSYGHRNMFGLAVHPTTGWIFGSENGGPVADEINRILPGGNYAWPLFEGPSFPQSGFVDPLLTYAVQPSLTGVAFYVGSNYPGMSGDLFSCRWIDGEIHRLRLSSTGDAIVSDVVFDDLGHAFDVQMGPDGNLWVLHSDQWTWSGANEIGRYEFLNAPNPSVHLMSTSNKALGGSITLGFTARNGDLILPWLGFSLLNPPVSSPVGLIQVSIDGQLPLQIVAADDRAYFAASLPLIPSMVGVSLHAQALRVDPTTLQLGVTNASSMVLQ